VTIFERALDALARSPAGEPPAGEADPGAPAPRTDDVCLRLLAEIRKRCPGLVPDDPLPPGTPGAVVPVAAGDVGTLIGTAIGEAVARAATGRLPVPGRPPSAVLWRDGVDSLLVQVAAISVKPQQGVLAVIIPVACDQLIDATGAPGTGAVVVEIHVGTPDRPTGMLAATPDRPDGPPVVVERWGNALTAVAWRGVLDAAGGVAAAAGRDTDGAPLVPVALVAGGSGIAVLPQARQSFDRERPGQVAR
jgi:hypothetical protein